MKYSLYANKQDYANIYSVIESLEKELNTKFDWKKIKRATLDQLEVLVSILKRKAPTPKVEDSVVVTKIKNIDTDNIKLGVVITKDGKVFETEFQYIISANSAHHSDIKFEHLMETHGVDIDQIRDDIESRKLRIN